MMAPTHIVFGLFSTTGLFSMCSISLHKDLPAVGAVILGSLLPDIDSPRSSLGRLLPFVSAPVERRWGHRTVTHCMLAAGALSVLLLPLCFYRGTMYAALLIGYLSHLLIDCATKSGVPLFHPHPSRCVLPGNSRYRVKTGSLGEHGVLLVLLLMLALVFPLSSIGGTWRALRYLMATTEAAYSNYRETTTEMMLEFEGRWRTSRQPVEGTALILEGQKTKFLIAFEGETWVYGESGDILPDKTRAKATKRTIRVDTVGFQAALFREIVDPMPASFVSGKLESDRVFLPRPKGELSSGLHEGIRISDRELTFEYAPRSRVAQLGPVHPVDPDQLSQLQQQLDDGTQALMALQLRRPPVHYLQLREAEARLAERKREIASLQDSTVRFTGKLFLRIPGKEEP